MSLFPSPPPPPSRRAAALRTIRRGGMERRPAAPAARRLDGRQQARQRYPAAHVLLGSSATSAGIGNRHGSAAVPRPRRIFRAVGAGRGPHTAAKPSAMPLREPAWPPSLFSTSAGRAPHGRRTANRSARDAKGRGVTEPRIAASQEFDAGPPCWGCTGHPACQKDRLQH